MVWEDHSFLLFLYKFTPWHQLLYTCGRIHVIRHIQEYRIEVLEKFYNFIFQIIDYFFINQKIIGLFM